MNRTERAQRRQELAAQATVTDGPIRGVRAGARRPRPFWTAKHEKGTGRKNAVGWRPHRKPQLQGPRHARPASAYGKPRGLSVWQRLQLALLRREEAKKRKEKDAA